MRVFRVVILHPVIDPCERAPGVRKRIDPDIVALEGLYEGFGHAVALGAFHWREAGLEVQGCSDLEGAIGSEDRTDVRQPLDPVGCARRSPNRCSTHCTIMFLTISPEIPAVVDTQLMTSRSWLSSANAGELEHVRAPAHVGTTRHDGSLMRTRRVVRCAGPAAIRSSSSAGRPAWR